MAFIRSAFPSTKHFGHRAALGNRQSTQGTAAVLEELHQGIVKPGVFLEELFRAQRKLRAAHWADLSVVKRPQPFGARKVEGRGSRGGCSSLQTTGQVARGISRTRRLSKDSNLTLRSCAALAFQTLVLLRFDGAARPWAAAPRAWRKISSDPCLCFFNTKI